MYNNYSSNNNNNNNYNNILYVFSPFELII